MSNVVDQRVVEMRFDNKQFESGVSTTMSTLDKLKQKLNLTGASKGLDGLNAAAKNVNISGLGGAVDTVTAKFSALQVMGVTALANITNSAINTGKQMIKSLTIDPVKTGFNEYELKMGSIQTIMAGTGESLATVNQYLNELNAYSDQTIYSFKDMTESIGKFTNAGVKLEDAVAAIKGISNEAAVSGATASQASHAMYNFAQALSSGYVKLIDWKSIENAQMATVEFKQQLIDTAVEVGTLKEVGEGMYETLEGKAMNATKSFNDTLQDQWMTSDVLIETLKRYADETTEIGAKSSEAATKVKTFTQLMDTLKESAQSGWAQTWENVVGNFEEARELFTELSDLFGGIIGDSSDRRNNLIKGALGSNWEKLTSKINEAGVKTKDFEKSIENVVGKTRLDELTKKFGSIEKAVRAGKISSEELKTALSSIGGEAKKALNFDDIAEQVKGNKFLYSMGGLGKVSDEVKRIQEALNSLGYDISADGKFGKATYQAVMAFQKAEGIKIDGIVGEETIAALEKATGDTGEITDNVKDLSKECEGLVEDLTKPSGRELLLDSVMNIIKAIHRPLAAVGEAFRNIFSISPDQLYNALEGINKFTSKFVMKGVLDADSWGNLTDEIRHMGIETSDFTNRLSEVLTDHGVNVDEMIDKYGTWGKAFEEGAISMDVIKETLLSFDGISEAMLLGGETADKLRRALEGVFSIFKIIGSFAGGGLKFAFKVVTAVLEAFDMNILDVAANMGDALVNFEKWITEGNLIAKMFDNLLARLPGVVAQFKEWFAGFKETPAVQKLVTAIEAIRAAFDKLTNGEISVSEFASSLGTNLANALKSLPGIAVQIASDFIAGFVNGIGGSIRGVINNIVSFCTDFVAAFAEALGVQSPSWKAHDIAVDFFQGFINGCKAIFSTVKSVLGKVGEAMVKIFKDLWDSITDESGNIQWGKIVAGGIIVSVLWILKTFATAFKGIADAFGGLGDIFENIAKSIKSFSKVLNAYAWDLKAQALQKLAIAIAILVASLWVLTTIDDIGKLWNAVGVLVVLAGILVGLAFALDKMSAASVSVNKSGASIDGLKTGLMQIGIVIALLALTVKMIGDMDPESAKQGFIGLAALAGGLILFVAAMAGISLYAKDVGKIGTMMVKLAIAMMLLITVTKMVSGLSPDELGKGIFFAAAFTLFVAAISAVTKGSSDNINKVGAMAVKLAFAMALLVGVVKLASKLSAEEMGKGTLFVAGFTIFVGALVNVTQIGKHQKIAKLGSLVLGISFALALMVGVCKLVGKLSVSEILKGVAFATGFGIFLAVFVKALTISNEQKLAKVAGTMLALSVAIGILAGVSVLLGLVDLPSLTKGVLAVTVLSAMMALMTKSLKGAQNAKGAIMMMAVCIGVMAAAVIALSFVPFEKLAPAVAGMTILMSAFALMVKGLSTLKGIDWKAMLAVGILTAVVAGLAVALHLLKGLDPVASIGNAIALSALMLAMSAALRILGAMTVNLGNSLKGILALTLMAVPLLALVGVLKLMSGVENATANATTLIALATTLTLLLIPLTIIGAIATTGIGAGAIALGIVALLLMAVPLLALVGVLKLMSGVENATDNATLLIELVKVLTDVLMKLAIVAPLAVMGVGAMSGLVILIGAIGGLAIAIGALMSKFPSIQKFLDSGLPVLEQLAGSIGTMIGKFIGGIGEGLGESLVKIGTDIADFMDALKKASDNASGIDGSAFDGVGKLMAVLAGIGVTTVGTTLADIFTFGGTSMDKFQSDAVAFFEAMKEISKASTGVTLDEAGLDSILGVAKKLIDLQSSIETIGGVISFFTGRDDLGTFGLNVGLFIESMKVALSNLDGTIVNKAALDPIISAATSLAELQSHLEPIGGMITWFTGRDDLGTFGINVGAFIISMKTAMSSLAGTVVNTAALDPIISAAKSLADLQSHLEPIGGVITWFSGRDDLMTFGNNISYFINSMKSALSNLDGTKLDENALSAIIKAAQDLATLQSSLDPMGGVVTWFTGRDDLGKFGTNISDFAKAMGTLKTEMGENGISEDVVTSVVNAGDALIALQEALPEEGWFDGKMDLDTFASYVADFATAMGTFAAETATLDQTAIDTAISCAYRIKTLITSLSGLDASGLANFAGVGLGSGDGHLVNIGQAMGKYGEAVADLNVAAVNTSVTAAIGIKNLIASLVGLDTSGIENFKIGAIGTAMKDYADNVAKLDPTVVITSITAANSLKTFIAGLVGMDTSGIVNFDPRPIGEAMGAYARSVGGVDEGAMSSSISAANRLKNFISGLVGFDSSGVDAFKSAVNELATVDLDSIVSTFAGKAVEFGAASSSFIDAIVNGLNGGGSRINAVISLITTSAITTLASAATQFTLEGINWATKLATGIESMSTVVKDAGTSLAKNAKTGAASVSAKQTGKDFGDGFKKGVREKGQAAYDAGYYLGDRAIDGIKAALLSNSPSKRAMWTGEDTGDGFVIGLDSMRKNVYKSGYAMGEEGLAGISKSIAHVSDVINSDIDAQPTIRPVLDLSDVRSGADAIGSMFNSNPLGVTANVGAISTMMNRRGQNGANADVVSEIVKLRRSIDNMPRESYNINGVTYDDGSNIKSFAQAVVHQARLERRV